MNLIISAFKGDAFNSIYYILKSKPDNYMILNIFDFKEDNLVMDALQFNRITKLEDEMAMAYLNVISVNYLDFDKNVNQERLTIYLEKYIKDFKPKMIVYPHELSDSLHRRLIAKIINEIEEAKFEKRKYFAEDREIEVTPVNAVILNDKELDRKKKISEDCYKLNKLNIKQKEVIY